jgi:hypothetical protein
MCGEAHRLVPTGAGHVDARCINIARKDTDGGGTRIWHETSVIDRLSYQMDR